MSAAISGTMPVRLSRRVTGLSQDCHLHIRVLHLEAELSFRNCVVSGMEVGFCAWAGPIGD